MELEKRLTILRKENGLSQAELADRLNVTRQAISRWETGTSAPSTDNLISLAKLYGVSLDQLAGGDTDNLPLRMQPEKEIENKTKPEGQAIIRSWKKVFTVGLALIALIAAIWYFWILRQRAQETIAIADLPTEQVEISGTFSLKDLK